MANRVLTHLNPNVPSPHLMRHRRRCPRSEKGIENKIAGIGEKFKDALDKSFWLLAFRKLHATFIVKIIRAQIVPKIGERFARVPTRHQFL